MSRASFFLIFLNSLFFCNICALDCKYIFKPHDRNISHVISTCMLPTIPVTERPVDNTTKAANMSDENDPEPPPIYGPRRGIEKSFVFSAKINTKHFAFAHEPLRNKRQVVEVSDQGSVTTSSSSTTVKPTHPYFSATTERVDPAKCVSQCIFQQFDMLNAKNFPDHDKVSEGILRDIQNREIEDFVQDNIDDCFGDLIEIVDPDPCSYAAKLITCFGDKGRYNCADWPVGDLPFPHKF